MQMWVVWMVLALLLAILEIFLPGLTLICMCVGGAAASVIAYLDMNMSLQLGTFCLVSFLCFLFIRPVLIAIFYKQDAQNATNIHALLGKKGVVTELSQENGTMWVRVQSEEWPAVNKNGGPMAKGTSVVVVGIEGNTLIVEGVE